MAFSSINRVVLIGRLTRDPELRSTPSGTSVCRLRIACNDVKRDPDGEYQQRPGFFDVSVFGLPAENVSRYMAKGNRVAVDGRLQWREWETSDQQRRQAVSVVADSVQFLDNPSAWREGEGPQGQAPAEPGEAAEAGDPTDGGESSGEPELAGVGADEGFTF